MALHRFYDCIAFNLVFNYSKKRLISAFIFALLPQLIFGTPIGSNTSPLRQNLASFPSNATDNAMIGFSVFENGFLLSDNATSCSFNALFPVCGKVDLHGGNLYLMQNLVFSNTTVINSMGNLYGNGKKIVLASSITTLQSTATDVLPTFTTYNASVTINSCDWSTSGSFALVVTNNFTGGQEILVLGYDGINLTKKASVEISANVICARWQPGQNNFVVGLAAAANNLKSYSFNPITNTITAVSSLSLSGNEQINALSFNPGGNYVAIGRNSVLTGNQSEVWVHSMASNGTLTQITSANFPNSDQNVQLNAASWSPGSNYFAIGTAPVTGSPSFYLYYFNGTTITQTLGLTTGFSVRGVDYSPSGTHIAVAFVGGTSQNIRVYKHQISNGTLTDQTTAYVGQTTDANSVMWKQDGTQLLAGMALNASAAPLRLYNFNSTTTVLSLNSTITFGAAVGDCAWNPNGTQFCVASGVNFYVGGAYSNGFCFTVDRLNLTLQNNLILSAPLALFNTCTIDGNNHTIDFQNTGSMVIQPFSNLVLRNVTLKDISAYQLRCFDNTASVSLDNVQFIFDGDYFFDVGAFHVLSNFSLSGTNSFVYRSTQQSTIRTNATFLCDYGTTLSYAPASNQRTGISFLDDTGTLAFRGATLYSTATGLRLTQGNVIIDGKTIFQSDATIIPEGIAFGDGINANNDAEIVMMPGAQLSVASGFVVNENLS
jgi:hypothetical protein